MKAIYLILVICLFTSCNSQTTDENKNNKIETSYDNEFLLEQVKALYFINKIESLNLKLFTKEFSAIDIDTLIAVCVKDEDFKEKINNIKPELKSILLKKSNEWIEVKSSLDFAIDNSEDVDYLEFFYNNSKTRKIFDVYLKNPNQDWGSLSSSEQYEVYYQIINEIYLLDSKNKLILMSDFYNKMKFVN